MFDLRVLIDIIFGTLFAACAVVGLGTNSGIGVVITTLIAIFFYWLAYITYQANQ